MLHGRAALLAAAVLLSCAPARGQAPVPDDLAKLSGAKTRMQNALWIENPVGARFDSSKRVVVGDLQGPAVVTMIHFAMPETLKLNRDLLLQMTWDGEASPSVNVPLVDFFCDAAGLREPVDTALVNKRRGFNAWFPMPFRSSAKIELVYDGPVEPGKALRKIMPCYSYVLYRPLEKADDDAGTFHAAWRQEALLLGRKEYTALEAKGRGKFIGWNVSIRRPGRGDYPVDANEKFFVDGEADPSIEFQGLEDSFGFSWGFPPTESLFPLTGFYPFLKGAMAYRFFLGDAIRFEKSLRVDIGFGKNEDPFFRREFSKEGNDLQLSSTCYWYQAEPHAEQPPPPPAVERAPAPEDPFWRRAEKLPAAEDLRAKGVKLHMLCGRKDGEVIFAEPGFAAAAVKGFAYTDWDPPVYHCRAGEDEVLIDVTVPRGAAGTLRVYLIDPDEFQGGRKESLRIGGADLGTFEKLKRGKWIERPLTEKDTAEGTVRVRAANAREGANAAISIIQWVGPQT
jgi:hypothetical protein